MTISLEDVLASHGPDEALRFVAIADHFLTAEDLPAAAAALDRAYGLAPKDPTVARQRAAILDQLSVREHGLVWRYVPAGTFLMGSDRGDPDERPVHPRRGGAFWITDAPITWTAYDALLGASLPDGDPSPMGRQIRLQYCETMTLTATSWDFHLPLKELAELAQLDRAELEQFGPLVKRRDEMAPYTYDRKPMVGVSVAEIERLAAHLSGQAPPGVRYALPTEAQWEKAARGGLVGKRYAWGDEPPTPERCHFDRVGELRLFDPRELPPNGYGLYGMCGGVSEWTADIYDALAYQRAAAGDLSPPVPPQPIRAREGEREDEAPEPQRVLRGGSWCDCADAVTVSFRFGREPGDRQSPAIGFRLVRTVMHS